jgi:hypothetical protein
MTCETHKDPIRTGAEEKSRPQGPSRSLPRTSAAFPAFCQHQPVVILLNFLFLILQGREKGQAAEDSGAMTLFLFDLVCNDAIVCFIVYANVGNKVLTSGFKISS